MKHEAPQLELRTGRWQDALDGVEGIDAAIYDPPYSARVHVGARTTKRGGADGISYAAWTEEDHAELLLWLTARVRRWIVPLVDHATVPVLEQLAAQLGWYCFAPVPCVTMGGSVRKLGDGPACWTVFAVPMRPRRRVGAGPGIWRALPGAYVERRDAKDSVIQGGGDGRRKSTVLLRKLVADYTDEGDLVVDPTAGYGSTLLAAHQLGRRAIGAELDAGVAATARLGLFGETGIEPARLDGSAARRTRAAARSGATRAGDAPDRESPALGPQARAGEVPDATREAG